MNTQALSCLHCISVVQFSNMVFSTQTVNIYNGNTDIYF